MDKLDMIKWIIFSISFILESLIQIFGSINYKTTPSWVWALANILCFFIPLLEGMSKGLLVLIPVIISEFFWYFTKRVIGPILHAVAFVISGVILGAVHIFIQDNFNLKMKLIISAISFESFLFIEEILYYWMRKIFVKKKNEMSWKNISVSFVSIVNPIMLILLLCFMYYFNIIEIQKNGSGNNLYQQKMELNPNRDNL